MQMPRVTSGNNKKPNQLKSKNFFKLLLLVNPHKMSP